MSKDKKKSNKSSVKKKAWKTDSFDGALLFLLFHKRIIGHPDNYSAAEIQAHPSFGFNEYSAQTFKRNSQTVANKVKKFEDNGTGLTQEFKEILCEVLRSKPELFPDIDEDLFDDDYKDEDKEEDLTHISKCEEEVSLSDPLQDPRFEEKKAAPKSGSHNPKANRPTTNRSKKFPPVAAFNMTRALESKLGSYLEDYADGHVIGVYPLASGWDGTFKVGPDQMSVIMSTKVPKAVFSAKTILQRHGLDDNNIHVVSLQAAMTNSQKHQN